MPWVQRGLALSAYALLIGLVVGNWLWIDAEFLLSSRAAKFELILVVVYLGLLKSTNWMPIARKKKLDERELAMRAEMVQKTYRVLFWGVIAAYILGVIILGLKSNEVVTSFWQFTSRGMQVHAFRLMVQYCLTGLVLPAAFLAWREAKLAKNLR